MEIIFKLLFTKEQQESIHFFEEFAIDRDTNGNCPDTEFAQKYDYSRKKHLGKNIDELETKIGE